MPRAPVTRASTVNDEKEKIRRDILATLRMDYSSEALIGGLWEAFLGGFEELHQLDGSDPKTMMAMLYFIYKDTDILKEKILIQIDKLQKANQK